MAKRHMTAGEEVVTTPEVPPSKLPYAAPRARPRTTILFLAVNAEASQQLKIDEECRAIENRLRSARHRDDFELISKWAVRRDELQRHLLEHRPDIVHFAGHGTTKALLLLDEAGQPAPLPVEALVKMLETLHDHLRLVVLNACFAEAQALAIRDSVGIAVGMSASISDKAAIAFAPAFYEALAFGRSVKEAFELGVAAVKAQGGAEGTIPRLLAHDDVDPATVRFVRSRGSKLWPFLVALVALVAIALVVLLKPPPAPPNEPPVPAGMARVRGATIEVGDFNLGLRPPECKLSPDEDCTKDTHPERTRQIAVESFDLDRAEVTNQAFADWLATEKSAVEISTDGVVRGKSGGQPLVWASEDCDGLLVEQGQVRVKEGHARRPVVCVSWYGASDFCHAAGKRLPFDAEWELAAKGVERRPFPWGSVPPRRDGVAFDRGLSIRSGAADVGTSTQDVTPNEGIRDLGGNVAEWVDEGLIRGGSWRNQKGGVCHLLTSGCAFRPRERYNLGDVGFRCARTPPKETK